MGQWKAWSVNIYIASNGFMVIRIYQLQKQNKIMSIMYCHNCDKYIDTDWDAEHFTEDGNCIKFMEYQITQEEQ